MERIYKCEIFLITAGLYDPLHNISSKIILGYNRECDREGTRGADPWPIMYGPVRYDLRKMVPT